MFEKLRLNVARAITPKAAAALSQNRLNLASALTPGAPVYSDMTVRKASREGYKMSVSIYRGVRTIIQAASAIPWIALDDDGTMLPDHDFTKLMARPNTEFSGQDMIEMLIGHLCLAGNGLWQPLMVNGRAREFWPVMPDLVQPIPSEVSGKWLDGYQITLTGGGQKVVPPETFIHFMQTDPGNPYWGIGPLMAAARTVDTDNEAQDTQKVSMQNRGIPSGILSPTEGELTEEEYLEQKKRFEADYTGKSKRRGTWFFNKGMKWEQMGLSPVEMDYIASRLSNKRDIAAALGISPIFLGDLEQSSYNNMAEARKALYQDAVIPMLDDIKATLQMKVGDSFGIQVGYDLSNVAALREDFGKKVISAQTLWNMSVPFDQINSNLELGFEEFPGWNRSYIPFGLMPAGEGGSTEQDIAQPVDGQVVDTAANIAAGDKLNGIQITAAQTVIRNLIDGLIPAFVALELLVAVGIDRDNAQMMIDASTSFTPTVSQIQEAISSPAKSRLLGQPKNKAMQADTEEQKAALWKRQDTRRQGWWAVVGKKITPLYDNEATAILKALKGKTEADAARAAQSAIESTADGWIKAMTAAYTAVVEDIGTQTAQDLGMKPKSAKAQIFDPFSESAITWIKKQAGSTVKTILDTDIEAVRQIILNGFTDGQGIPEISKLIRSFYDDNSAWKAARVARTEVSKAASFGQVQAAKQSGVVDKKIWLTARDSAVRDLHQEMEGESVSLDSNFSNGLEAPGLGDDPAQIINCRCVLLFGF